MWGRGIIRVLDKAIASGKEELVRGGGEGGGGIIRVLDKAIASGKEELVRGGGEAGGRRRAASSRRGEGQGGERSWRR